MNSARQLFCSCIQSGLLATILGEATSLASAPLPCNRIRFLPMAGAEAAVLGGKFLGSINGHDRGYVPLGEIKAAPAAGEWGEIPFENRVVYRWYRYEAPAGSYGKIAEIELYNGPTLLNPGTVARSWGSFGVNEGRMPAMAFDHNPKSAFWNEAAADGQFIVLDLLGAATAAIPLFTPDLNQQDGPLDLRIESSPGALIRYTLDGSIPDLEHGLAYVGPIPLRARTTISATAYFPDGGPSPVNTATCLVPESSKPGFSTLHFGNSLTATCSQSSSFSYPPCIARERAGHKGTSRAPSSNIFPRKRVFISGEIPVVRPCFLIWWPELLPSNPPRSRISFHSLDPLLLAS